MKRLITVMFIMSLFMPQAFAALGNYPINYRNVSNPATLDALLRNRIGGIEDEIGLNPATGSRGTGKVFYVDSAVGADTYTGKTLATATATLDAAIALCTASRGDVIYVMQGHAETIGTVALDIAGITIIGLGTGNDMPTLTFDGATDEIAISVNNVFVTGLRLVAGIADVANAFDMQAGSDYSIVAGCEFPEPGTATFDFTTCFQMVTGADNVTIAYNTWINQAATPGATKFIDGGAAAIDSLSVIGNYINCDASVAALLFSDQADTNLRIEDNIIIQEDIDQLCIELTTTATGIIKNNTYVNLGGPAYFIDPGSCIQVGNLGGYAIDSANLDVPLMPGKQYTMTASLASITATTVPIFTITGGPILIEDFFGVVTGTIGASDLTIQSVDAAGPTTFPYSTTVACDSDAIGTTYTFTGAVPSVLTPLAGAQNGGAALKWYAPIGTVDQLGDAAVDGITVWSMTFVPLADGVIVVGE